jgi:predicted short-subunit dehydrogenase-like oxidoreductase (DUF2520 family)
MRRPRRPRVVVVGGGRAAGSLLASLRQARVQATRTASRGAVVVGEDVDVVFLAVSDQAIADVAASLVVSAGAARSPIIAHVAGSLGRDVLGAHVRRGVFHPLASLDGATVIPHGCLCACDADDDDDEALLESLARRLRLAPVRVRDADRARYHAAAVIAGNLATGLLQLGVDELLRIGVDEDVARHALARLLASTAARAVAQPLAIALTGPVARGDVETVSRHLAVLDDDTTRTVYRLLTRVLVERVRPASAVGRPWALDGER